MRKKMILALMLMMLVWIGTASADNRVEILADTIDAHVFNIPVGIETDIDILNILASFYLIADGDLTAIFGDGSERYVIINDHDRIFYLCDRLWKSDSLLVGHCFTWGMNYLLAGDLSEPVFSLPVTINGTEGNVCINKGNDWLWTMEDGVSNLDPIFNNGEGPHCMTFVLGCGDPNADGSADVSDAVYIINYIFTNGPPSVQFHAGDVTCSGDINIHDAVYLINYIFDNGRFPCDPDDDGEPDC